MNRVRFKHNPRDLQIETRHRVQARTMTHYRRFDSVREFQSAISYLLFSTPTCSRVVGSEHTRRDDQAALVERKRRGNEHGYTGTAVICLSAENGKKWFHGDVSPALTRWRDLFGVLHAPSDNGYEGIVRNYRGSRVSGTRSWFYERGKRSTSDPSRYLSTPACSWNSETPLNPETFV